jgi:hypothetical protein
VEDALAVFESTSDFNSFGEYNACAQFTNGLSSEERVWDIVVMPDVIFMLQLMIDSLM